ncbi:uncharacterized protein ACNLHF_001312 [Anomaloglossus baeobatrachus]
MGNDFGGVIREDHFQFVALPFGLATAPRVFTKVLSLNSLKGQVSALSVLFQRRLARLAQYISLVLVVFYLFSVC